VANLFVKVVHYLKKKSSYSDTTEETGDVIGT